MTWHDIIDLAFMALFMATPFIPFAILFHSHKQNTRRNEQQTDR